MVSLTLIAIWILKQAREPLTCEEIIEQAQTQNFLQSPDPALEARLDAELNSDVNTRGAHSFFSKLAPRTFALNPDLPKLEDLPLATRNYCSKSTVRSRVTFSKEMPCSQSHF